ncbi:MAG: methionine biosynthesis protein MetW [Gammaproteobacteria bacterium]|nr:methionine biosynthesis protein MetW [Gammaproteobacteria bacterium]|tara:strand:- start:2454 stop:3050 length:597 start_codon:yes stop_codon:yes gene_type:complete
MIRVRGDLALISSWIKPNSKVLDLGCGDGDLLKLLKKEKNIQGYGVDSDIIKIKFSLDNNINVLQLDLDNDLSQFDTNSFDYVVLAQSLQEIKRPKNLIKEMLRIGDEIIVSFPNMGHWTSRIQLLFKGMMPITKNLPFKWDETPNIHLCTIKDFIEFCNKNNFKIIEQLITDENQKCGILTKIFPNFFGQVANYRIK